jgi:Holliday junction resolvase RusA-like endonuclease
MTSTAHASACPSCFGRGVVTRDDDPFTLCPNCHGRRAVVTMGDALAAKRAVGEAPTFIRVVIDGEPVPKGRPRFARVTSRAGSVVVRTYTPAETEAYEAKVRTHAKLAANRVRWAWSKDDRFSVLVTIYRQHVDAGGDLDNYAKLAIDALIHSPKHAPGGVLMKDDRYVRGLGAALKHDPDRPRMEIEVRRFKKGAA